MDSDYSRSTMSGCFINTIVFLLFTSFIMLLGVVIGKGIERNKAIEANAGRWIIDPKTGDKDFHYGVE